MKTSFEPPRILIAEDNRDTRILLEHYLDNYQLIFAFQAKTAIEYMIFEEHLDGIVSDFDFHGETINGYDIYKDFRDKFPLKPYFLFSSDSNEKRRLFTAELDFIVEKIGGFGSLRKLLDSFFDPVFNLCPDQRITEPKPRNNLKS